MEQEIIAIVGTVFSQAGSAAIVGLMFIAYLYFDNKKKSKDPLNGTGKLILDELQKQNGNHLHTIQEEINCGFKDLTESIHQDNIKIIQLLGEIKGKIG